MTSIQRLTVGLIVNSFAGIGGETGFKGSDGCLTRQAALQKNPDLRAPVRLAQCLTALQPVSGRLNWKTGQSLLGEDYLREHAMPNMEVVYEHGRARAEATESNDTRSLACALVKSGIDLIVFCGGDGTARDVLDAVGERIPCLGLPSGVKMQSGVFAVTPAATAQVIMHLLEHDLTQVSEQDVRDIDEAALRQGKVRSRYYGSMLVPDEPRYLQNLKVGGVESEPLVLDEISDYLAEQMSDSGALYLVGPGTTTAHWMASMGLQNTLVGFDAVRNSELVASDLDAEGIEALLAPRNQTANKADPADVLEPDVYVVITPTGHQGILLGRGNQQLTPAILRRMDKQQLIIVATKNKLKDLQSRPLIVDTNDADLDVKLCGLYPVITGYNDQVLYPVNLSYE